MKKKNQGKNREKDFDNLSEKKNIIRDKREEIKISDFQGIDLKEIKCRRCLKLVDPESEIVEQGLCSDCLVRVGLLIENKRF